MLIQEPYWPGLAAEHRVTMEAAWHQFVAGDSEGAATRFETAYRRLLERQPEGHRFHKGESLHNWGLALMWTGPTAEAMTETLAALSLGAALHIAPV